MKLTIRLERPEDYREVEALTREAFWGVFHPTCDEHYLVHKLRNSRDFVPALDMVAESDGRIVWPSSPEWWSGPWSCWK